MAFSCSYWGIHPFSLCCCPWLVFLGFPILARILPFPVLARIQLFFGTCPNPFSILTRILPLSRHLLEPFPSIHPDPFSILAWTLFRHSPGPFSYSPGPLSGTHPDPLRYSPNPFPVLAPTLLRYSPELFSGNHPNSTFFGTPSDSTPFRYSPRYNHFSGTRPDTILSVLNSSVLARI